MTPRRRMSPEARRREIVAAARPLFATRPLSTITTADVAATAGVTRSLVHHYFGGIRGVFLAVVADGAVALTAARAAGPETPLPERLERNVAASLDIVEANRETWLAATGAAGVDEDTRVLADAARRLTVQRALKVNRDLLEDTPAARLALGCFHAFSTEATRAWLAGETTRDEVERLLVTALQDLITRTLPAIQRTPAKTS